jgi:hypothetical protein
MIALRPAKGRDADRPALHDTTRKTAAQARTLLRVR